MTAIQERFPKAKLFARAAELQELVEYWQGTTALKSSEASDMGLHMVADKLTARYLSLDEARQAVTKARQLLYKCP